MNVNKKVMALETATGVPVVPDLYEGDSDKWITFTYTDERGTLYGDDDEELVTVTLNVVLYTPTSYNYFTLKEKIKQALKNQDFQLEYIQSWVINDLDGVERFRQTIFHVTYTGIDN